MLGEFLTQTLTIGSVVQPYIYYRQGFVRSVSVTVHRETPRQLRQRLSMNDLFTSHNIVVSLSTQIFVCGPARPISPKRENLY